jgi:hypothetical protein
MLNRVLLLAFTLFWAVMLGLLLRAEFGAQSRGGVPVPVEVVWEKLLKAPDVSHLEIRQHGKRIGSCKWSADVGEVLTIEQLEAFDRTPAGQVRQISGYALDFSGSVTLGEERTLYRFDFDLQCATNNQWETLQLRLTHRPRVVEIRSAASEQTVTLRIEDDGSEWERAFRLDQLRDPRRLVRAFGGPWLAEWYAALVPDELEGGGLSVGLEWQAATDWLRVGGSRISAYRLEARLLDRYGIRVLVSRAGEILRVELPEDIVLINESFAW